MNLVSIKNLGKSRGGSPLFTDITFGLEACEKTALIGANGTGKSTLLRLIAGRDQPDSGIIARRNDLRFAYLPQIPEFSNDATIMEHVLSGDSPVTRAIREYELCVRRLSRGQDVTADLERLTREMDRQGGWDLEHRVRAVLERLGLSDPERTMGTLSGGMVRKVELARALSGDFDLLLLDEPTNHLDLETIGWLQEMLAARKAAILLVTHDRYFLESICTKIFELDERKLFAYDGNYSVYLEKRAQRLEAETRRQERLQSVLRRELVWLKRGPKARTGKDGHRKAVIHGMIASVAKKEENTMEFTAASRRLGKKVLEVKHLSKSYSDRPILRDFSFSFERGARLGILGPNGSGKSTFLKLLMGKLAPDSGEVDIGINTKIGYFDQLSEEMDGEQTVYGYLSDYADDIRRAGGEAASVSTLLEEFKFPDTRHRTKIKNLSGGERRRLYLLKILIPAPNFLLFDEPTNDLDIRTLSLLEDFLIRFEGCLVVASHDRYFLDRTADLLLLFDGSGDVAGFAGTASEYLDLKNEERSEAQRQEKATERKPTDGNPETSGSSGGEKKKLSFRERKEFESLIPELDTLEAEKAELEAFFSSGTGATEIPAAQKRYREVSALIEEKTARWETLAEREG